MVVTVRFQVWSICWNVRHFGVFFPIFGSVLVYRLSPTNARRHARLTKACSVFFDEGARVRRAPKR